MSYHAAMGAIDQASFEAATEVKVGVRYWKPEIISRLLWNFDTMSTGSTPDDRNNGRSQIVWLGNGTTNVGAWMKSQFDAGRTIFASPNVVFPSNDPILPELVSSEDTSEFVEISKTLPVVAYPGMTASPPPTCPSGQVPDGQGKCGVPAPPVVGSWWKGLSLSSQFVVIGGVVAAGLVALVAVPRLWK